MTRDPNEFKKYFPPPAEVEPRVEVPPTPPSPPPEPLPSGMTPMEQVKLEGIVAKGLSHSRRTPWWVMITGWIVLGGPALMLIYIALTAGFWGALLPATLGLLMLWLLVQGTWQKLK